MTKYRYKIGRSMSPIIELLDDSEAREHTIRLGKWFNVNCKCYAIDENRKIYEYKKMKS